MDFWLFLQVSVHHLSLSLAHTHTCTHTHTHLHALLCVYRWAVELTPTHTEVRSQEGSWHICARNENCILIILQKRFFCFGPKKTGGDETGDETRPKKSSATPDFDANEAFARRSCGPEPVGWNYGLQIRMKIILVTSIIISWLSLPDKKESGRSRSGKSSELAKSRTKPG